MFHAQLSRVTIRRLVPNPNPCGDLRFVHLDSWMLQKAALLADHGQVGAV